MKISFIPRLLLSSFTLLIFSCGAGGGSISLDAVQTQDSLLTEQAGRMMMIQSALEVNRKALVMPFESDVQPGEGVSQEPPKNPLAGFSAERLEAFKIVYTKAVEELNTTATENQLLLDEITVLQKQLYDAQAELKADALTDETTTGFTLIPDQIAKLKTRIDAIESKFNGVQREIIQMLMSEEVLQPTASWLMVNSPMI